MTHDPTTSVHRAAVDDVVTSLEGAWASGDADAFAARFHPRATLVGDAYMHDRDDIRAFMRHGFDGPYRGTRIAVRPVSVRAVDDAVCWAVTEGAVLVGDEVSPKDASADRAFVATVVLVRDDAGWQVISYQNDKGMSSARPDAGPDRS